MLQQARTPISVRLLKENEIEDADRIFRLAFGTFLGLPNPIEFMGDAGYVKTRWRTDPTSAFAAEVEGVLAGSNFATNWGSVGFFGPLSVRSELWDQGIGGRLVEPVMQRFAEWKTEHVGLFTWSHSPKHSHLYQKFGFWPRFLTAIMAKPVARTEATGEALTISGWSRFSDLSDDEREEALKACQEVTAAIYAGLDLSSEIKAVAGQNLGETVLLHDSSKLAGFAVCHCGADTEAGSGTCYVKFGAVSPGADARRNFDRLLDACEALTALQGMQVVVAGVNMGRYEAYRALLQNGFRIELQGVAMHQQNQPGYSFADAYVVDDWR